MKFSYKKLFKKYDDAERISMYYMPLFSTNELAEAIYSRFQSEKVGEIHIKNNYEHIVLNSKFNLQEITESLYNFQKNLRDKIDFSLFYYKDSYDILFEIWLKESKYQNYRRRVLKSLFKQHRKKRISIYNILTILKVMSEVII